jgi:hypothetical protein
MTNTIIRLYNFLDRNVSMIQINNTITSLVIDDNEFEVSIAPEESISWKKDNLVIELRRNALSGFYSGYVLDSGDYITVYSPLSTTYQLQVSDDVKDSSEKTDTSVYKDWKQLTVAIHRDQDNALTANIKLDKTEGHILSDTITFDPLPYSEGVDNLQLSIDTITNSLKGTYQKSGDQSRYKLKAIVLSTKETELITFETQFSLNHLNEISSYVDNVDKAQEHSQEAFQQLMMYSMDETYVKTFFGQNKPQLEAGLHDILHNNNIEGERTAKEFFEFFSYPVVASNLFEKDDEVLNKFKKKFDQSKVTNYLEREVSSDINYQRQNNLLYVHGYKKAVPKIVDYIQDQHRIGYQYWAQRLFYKYTSIHKITEVKSILTADTFKSNPDSVKDIFSAWSTKIKILGSANLSQRLSTVTLFNGVDSASKAKNYLDDDYNLTFKPDDEDRKAFIALLQQVADETGDEDTQEILDKFSNSIQSIDSLMNFAYIFASIKDALNPADTWQKILNNLEMKDRTRWSTFREIFGENPNIQKGLKIFSLVVEVFTFGAAIFSLCAGNWETGTDLAALVVNIVQGTLSLTLQVIDMAASMDLRLNAVAYKTLMNTSINAPGVAPTWWQKKVMSWYEAPEPGVLNAFKHNMKNPIGWLQMVTFLATLASSIIASVQLDEAIKSGDETKRKIYIVIVTFSYLQCIFIGASLFTTAGKWAMAFTIGSSICSLVVLAMSLWDLFRPQDNPTVDQLSNSTQMNSFKKVDHDSLTTPSIFYKRDELKSGNYTLKLDSTRLYIHNGNSDNVILEFESTEEPAIKLSGNALIVIDNKSSDLKAVASKKYDKSTELSEYPLVLKLSNDGHLSVSDKKKLLLQQ